MTSEATSPTTARLIDLLWDQRLQDQVVMRARDRRNLRALEVLKLAREQFGDVEDLESRLDSAVIAAGGERYPLIDPGRWLPDLLKRIAGKPRPPRDDYYSLPRIRSA